MKPVYQTRLSREQAGNCYEACIASVLEVPLECVPDFGALVLDREPAWPFIVAATPKGEGLPWLEGIDEEYHHGLLAWCRDLGLELWEFDLEEIRRTEAQWLDECAEWDRYWIASTQVSPEFRHATVWRGRDFVHQPTPGWSLDRETLGPVKAATVIATADPALLARRLPMLQGELVAA